MTAKNWVSGALMIAALSGCAAVNESRFNPLNLFRSDDETPAPGAAVSDRRPLVQQITNLTIERTPGGAIIRATGLPPTQGWFGAELVTPDPDGRAINGVLTFAFRIQAPETQELQGSVQSREVTAGIFVSNRVLVATRTVQVTGQLNSRAIRP